MSNKVSMQPALAPVNAKIQARASDFTYYQIERTGGGTAITGASTVSFQLPNSGYWEGNKAAILYNLTINISSNEAHLARGNAWAPFNQVTVLYNNVAVWTLKDAHIFMVQYMKWRKSADWYGNAGPTIGYYSSATDVAAAANEYILFLPDECPLSKKLDLSRGRWALELSINGTTSEWTSTNTGSNARTFSANGFKLIAPVHNNPITSDMAQNVLHYREYRSVPLDVVNGSSTVVQSANLSSGIISGIESYFYHSADLTADTLNDKLWDTQFLACTSWSVNLGGKTLTQQPIVPTNGCQLYYHLLNYLGYSISDSSKPNNESLINNIDATDGDAVFAMNFNYDNEAVDLSKSKISDLRIEWRMTVGESTKLYTFIRYDRLLNLSNGKTDIDAIQK